MTITERAPAEHPTRRPARETPGGFHQCWYAVALSCEVEGGRVVGKDLLDGRVIVYRTSDGTPTVLSAYCRHLGADLSVGEVVGDNVRCLFHHWQFGADGGCRQIPASDQVPREARLFAFPTVERWGLIWAFNGTEPLYEVPSLFGVPDHELSVRPFVALEPMPVEPWIIASNSMDFQHVRIVHGVQFDKDPADIVVGDHTIEYDYTATDPHFGATMHQWFKLWGTNTLTMRHETPMGESFTLATGSPVGRSSTISYGVAAMRTDSGPPEQVAQMLEFGEGFAKQILGEDRPVLQGIHFREDVLVPADRALGRFLRYARQFPRAHPAAEFIV